MSGSLSDHDSGGRHPELFGHPFDICIQEALSTFREQSPPHTAVRTRPSLRQPNCALTGVEAELVILHSTGHLRYRGADWPAYTRLLPSIDY